MNKTRRKLRGITPVLSTLGKRCMSCGASDWGQVTVQATTKRKTVKIPKLKCLICGTLRYELGDQI